MRRIIIVALVLLTVGMFATASQAVAGGWAITTLDALPTEFHAGEARPVGFTVLQHGLHPADGLRPSIRIRPEDASSTAEFTALADGEPGHYVAQVRFPTAGAWTWEVAQGPYAVQPLG